MRLLPLLLLCVSTASLAEFYSPASNQAYPDNVYWGDTHLHTNLSVDANGMGNRLLTPDLAYRFAKGEVVRSHGGQPVQLNRSLDFLVVTDHAVNMGVMPRMQAGDPLLLRTEIGQRWLKIWEQTAWSTHDKVNAPDVSTWASRPKGNGFFWSAWGKDYVADETFRRSVWEEVCDNAERHNKPGVFTAFIGYEWTPPTQHPRSPNFHRNMIFADGKERACQVLPFSIKDSDNVEDLWAYLHDYEQQTGGRILAIPHNGNLSAGKMFAPVDYDGAPVDETYVRARHRWEPLYEMTQYKGDGETHPVLSPNDEFADFETWNRAGYHGELPEGWEDQKLYEYARSALKLGLGLQADFGLNPYKFGMIGATDSHTGFATADEDNFWGKRSVDEAGPNRARGSWWFASSGYAAVWATENSRSALFDAMLRREVYATTGPRIRLRFFGGWDFDADDALSPHLDTIGYEKGVPMGGDLTASGADSPSFLISAARDPQGANLDRIQVVKGWRDDNGSLEEKVYNVAWSDGRRISRRGGLPSVGSTVQIKNASYTNAIGSAQLSVVWQDPDFDTAQSAFYYVRVIEIPTPRWTAYDAAYFKHQDLPERIPMVIQERAYSSPIWYTP